MLDRRVSTRRLPSPSHVGQLCSKLDGVRESVNKSAAGAASLEYVKSQAVIKSTASAASLRGGRASGRLDHGFFLQFLAALAPKKMTKNNQNLGLCIEPDKKQC